MKMKQLQVIPAGKRQWIERGIFAYRERGENGRIRFGVSYAARYSDGTMRRKRELLPPDVQSIAAARKALHARLTDKDRGHVLPAGNLPTFAEFSQRYLHDRKDEIAASLPRARSAIRAACGVFGSVPMDKVLPHHIAEFKRQRLATCEPATAARDLSVVRSAFRYAVKVCRYRNDNPVTDVDPVSKWQAKPRRVLTREEEALLIEHAAPHVRPFITIACNTGLRLSELTALQWSAVNLAAGLITVVEGKNRKVQTVPINRIAREAFMALRGDGAVGPVFTYEGRPWKNPPAAIASAARRAGLEGITCHCFRHTCCTRLIEAGVDLPRVKAWMRHANIATTMVYVHVDGLDAAAEKLAAFVESGPRVALASVSPLVEKRETE